MKAATIAHCDWSVDPAKRWLCTGRVLADSSAAVDNPRPVGAVDSFLSSLRSEAPTGPILVGFDFPIGIPRHYAARTEITRFPDALLSFGRGEWTDFYEVCETPHQISPFRPFYPKRSGETKKEHLTTALGLRTEDLLRECERATPNRAKACELFWTLGANQVGRAAIHGWRDLLAPALRRGQIAIWPFDGDLELLMQSDQIIVAETYPAEIYSHLGLTRGFGKRTRDGRRSQARAIVSWRNQHRVSLAPKLASDIASGFGETKVAEDIFDSVVGLLGMIEVATNIADFGIPPDPAVRSVEGWILGLRAGSRIEKGETCARSATISETSVNLPEPLHTPDRRLCPACEQKVFARWPSGWDGHAAYRCRGIPGGTPEARKQVYKQRYLKQ